MVILCCKPFFVFASPGYARVSLSEFTMEDFGKKQFNEATGKKTLLFQRLIHQTKLSVQRCLLYTSDAADVCAGEE